jgi:hypothetical protein
MPSVSISSDSWLFPLQKPYKQELGGMLAALVMPCLASPYGHLRAKAAWVIGQYCDVQFPDGSCQGPTFNLCFQKVRGANSSFREPWTFPALLNLSRGWVILLAISGGCGPFQTLIVMIDNSISLAG